MSSAVSVAVAVVAVAVVAVAAFIGVSGDVGAPSASRKSAMESCNGSCSLVALALALLMMMMMNEEVKWVAVSRDPNSPMMEVRACLACLRGRIGNPAPRL